LNAPAPGILRVDTDDPIVISIRGLYSMFRYFIYPTAFPVVHSVKAKARIHFEAGFFAANELRVSGEAPKQFRPNSHHRRLRRYQLIGWIELFLRPVKYYLHLDITLGGVLISPLVLAGTAGTVSMFWR
jgi:hypothetical protein